MHFADNGVDAVDVPDEVHDDAVHPTAITQVIPVLLVNLDEVDAVTPDEVVTEQVHGVGNSGECHSQAGQSVKVHRDGEGGVERIYTRSKSKKLPSGSSQFGKIVVVVAVVTSRSCHQLARVLESPDQLVMTGPA